MKNLVKKILSNFGYALIKILPPDNSEQQAVIEKGKSIIRKISPDFTILNGPFKGIKYPSIDITELTLVPKISGSYEAQLAPLINRLAAEQYDHIIDVGCAEGYYAVGLAKQHTESTVHCYDVNEHDLEFCRKFAALNGCLNLTYNKFCAPETLINFDFGNRSLILCDCEGYELDLFTPEAIKALIRTEVLVELHDVLNPAISDILLKRFAASHDVQIIDNSNMDFSELAGLENLTPTEKAFAVYEHRGGLHRNIFMEWAYFTPKDF